MSQITKDTIIADILDIAPETVPLFQAIGMHCLGCAMASGETLGEACEVHGVDADEFLRKLTTLVKQ
jgi:hybrid cluster-associated redox disulfide protein